MVSIPFVFFELPLNCGPRNVGPKSNVHVLTDSDDYVRILLENPARCPRLLSSPPLFMIDYC